jgi:hypothetical protein
MIMSNEMGHIFSSFFTHFWLIFVDEKMAESGQKSPEKGQDTLVDFPWI